MIINFSIQNFGPIKEKQTLSFEADKGKHLEEYYVMEPIPGLRLLKLALIYGANASGKSSILKALDFLRNMVLEPLKKKTDTLNFEPFLFDPITPSEDSMLSIEFLQNKIRYYYEVEFNKKAIIQEELKFYNPNKKSIFKRTTDIEKQLTKITFKNKEQIKIEKTAKDTLESNTLWNNTVLGGFIKTNIEQKELKDVKDWFEEYLSPIIIPETKLEGFATSIIDKKRVNKKDIVNILQKADLNISDIIIEEKETELPDGLLEFIKKQKNVPSEVLSELNKGRVTTVEIAFEHTLKNVAYQLSFEQESEGTKRYYAFASLISLLIRNSTSFAIDELEASLHPDLYIHFLLSFLANAKQSQLIATTHNREILNNRDLFRDDAIWFTDKQEGCATQLYSLADFDTSVIRDTSNVYNAYKIGKLGGVPNLGDYYIDLDDEAEE